jgi:uncharacterized protein DUF4149
MTDFLSERLILTLWVGSLWAIGYIAVPMAFATLGDVTLAGHYAGKLFSTVNILGLGCGTVLLLTKLISFGKQVLKQWRFWLIVIMVLLTLMFVCYLQPEIAAIKQLAWQNDDTLLEQFSFLHAVSKNLYMVISLLGLALVISSDKLSGQAEV